MRKIQPGTCVRVLGLNRGRAIRKVMRGEGIVTAQRRVITVLESTSWYMVWHLGVKTGPLVPVCGSCLAGACRRCRRGKVRCDCKHAVPVDVGVDKPRKMNIDLWIESGVDLSMVEKLRKATP